MIVDVKYRDDAKAYKFSSIESITNHENVIYINCSYNRLTSLPDNMNFPNLQIFDCSNNKLSSLPANMNFPNLQTLKCSYNKLSSLPDNLDFPNLQILDCCYNKLSALPANMNFPNLQTLDCSYNRLSSLPDNLDFPNLRTFDCTDNKLSALPDNLDFPNLQHFYCMDNKLTSLPDNMNFPNLQIFDCSYNNLSSLPVCIMNWRNLIHMNYNDNGIELSPQIERFINRLRTGSNSQINVYTDVQNVHNSSIQSSVRDSINRLTTRQDLPKFDAETLNIMNLSDDTLSEHVKARLIDYCSDKSVHSLLLLTFAEVLWYVLNTITHDFKDSLETQTEIKRVLNQEIMDAECKCFTGRMNRVVNCLQGFSPLVDIRISDEEQIGNVIVMLRDKALNSEGNYSVSRHKQLVEHELEDRGYDSDVISKWLDYIE